MFELCMYYGDDGSDNSQGKHNHTLKSSLRMLKYIGFVECCVKVTQRLTSYLNSQGQGQP